MEMPLVLVSQTFRRKEHGEFLTSGVDVPSSSVTCSEVREWRIESCMSSVAASSSL